VVDVEEAEGDGEEDSEGEERLVLVAFGKWGMSVVALCEFMASTDPGWLGGGWKSERWLLLA
jgi:hypothetical protein